MHFCIQIVLMQRKFCSVHFVQHSEQMFSKNTTQHRTQDYVMQSVTHRHGQSNKFKGRQEAHKLYKLKAS